MNVLVGTTQRKDEGCSSSSSAEGIRGHSGERRRHCPVVVTQNGSGSSEEGGEGGKGLQIGGETEIEYHREGWK